MVLFVWMLLAVGYLWYGRPFLDLAWNFLIHDIPRRWRDDIAANIYFRIVMQAVLGAILLWILGLITGFALSRGSDATMAQTVMFMTTMLSGSIVFVGLVVADKAVGALVSISPLTQRMKRRITLRRKGLLAYGWLALSFEFFVTLAFIIAGVYTRTWLVGLFLFVLFGYLVTSKAYNLPITWLPGLKVKTQVGLMFGILTIVGLCFMPFTRQYFGVFGLSPGTFVNKSVVDTTALDDANLTRKVTKQKICDKQIATIKAHMKSIKEDDPKALHEHGKYSQELAAKEKACL